MLKNHFGTKNKKRRKNSHKNIVCVLLSIDLGLKK